MGGTGDPGGLSAAAPLVRHVAEVLAAGPGALPPDVTALVAVSGGRDSVGLLHLVAAARPDLDLVVGHVRHGLRDDAADVAAVQGSAAALGLRVVVRSVEVGAGRGPEDAARTARYAALRSLAEDVGAAAVLVGHTMDDQAETVLLRIARGTGVPGLAAMDVRTRVHGVPVVRPLLALRRDAVRAVAAGWPWVEDPTNADPDQRRARARVEALPALRRLHPAEADVVPLLARLADLARSHRDCPADRAQRSGGEGRGTPAGERARRVGMAVHVPLGAASERGLAVQRLRAAWARLPDAPPWPGGTVVRRLLALPVGGTVDLPGAVRATRLPPDAAGPAWAHLDGRWGAPGDRVVLCRADTPALPEVPLQADRAVQVPGFGSLRASVHRGLPPAAGPPPAPDRAARAWDWVLDVAGDHLPLAVRGRADGGDRAARRVLQTIPQPLRRQVPLVVDALGRVLAVGPVVLVPPSPGGPVVRLTATPEPQPGVSPDGGVGYPAPP